MKEDAQQKDTAKQPSKVEKDDFVVLVGTYKEKQLAWIKEHGVYNYPVKNEDERNPDACAKIKELWLYAGAKSERHAFSAEFVGIQSRAEFLVAHPTYKKLGPSKHAQYMVFKTKPLKNGRKLLGKMVVARVSDFEKGRGQTKNIAKAIKQFREAGEFAALVDYLPVDLANVPHEQFRVCETAVQLDFMAAIDVQQSRLLRDKYASVVRSGQAGQRLTCLDFFAGSGLVSKGLSEDFVTVWANDISAKKAQVFNANNEKDVLQVCPIENVRGEYLPPADLSWGSFPCQDLSLAGDMNGLYAARSGLFWQWLRVMDEMKERPPVVVAENVIGLVSVEGGKYYLIVHDELLKRGYRVGAVMLDAVHWVPQSRKRIFVVGVRTDIDVTGLVADSPMWCHPAPVIHVAQKVDEWTWWKLPRPTARAIKLDEVIDFSCPCDSSEDRASKLALIAQERIEKMNELSQTGRRAFMGYRRTRAHRQVLEVRTDGVAGCLRTPGGGSSRQIVLIADKGELNTRLLTVREAARLMGVEDTYRIPGSYNDGYMAMGDAVAVPVVRFLSQALLLPLASRAKGVEACSMLCN